MQEREIDLVYDTLENSFSWPGDRTPNVRAQNVNTVDEVPDSNWFTNRLGTRAVTVDELLKGPDTSSGPARATGRSSRPRTTASRRASRCATPAGQVWFLKFDPPGYRAMATGTEVVVTKLFWALGYYVPEVHIATLRPRQLTIDEAARITPPNGNSRPFKHVGHPRTAPQGASRAGRLLPGHRQQGARRPAGWRLPVLRHPLRRSKRRGPARASARAARIRDVRGVGEPRGFEVDQHARHRHRSGWQRKWSGTTCWTSARRIGSAGVYPREAFEGSEYLVEGKKTLAGIPTFGLYVKDWRTAPVYRARSVGAFPIDNSDWDPEKWKPRYANSAFRSARLDDKFWAARRLQEFTDDMLKALSRAWASSTIRSRKRCSRSS